MSEKFMKIYKLWRLIYRCQWPRGLRRGSAAARLQGRRVRIPPVAWMSLPCECCLLSGRFVGLISRPEEFYRAWCVWVRSWSVDNEHVLAHWELLAHKKNTDLLYYDGLLSVRVVSYAGCNKCDQFMSEVSLV